MNRNSDSKVLGHSFASGVAIPAAQAALDAANAGLHSKNQEQVYELVCK